MESCKYCNKRIGDFNNGDYCDGVLTYDVSPFAVKIYDDYTESWDCEGSRYEAEMHV